MTGDLRFGRFELQPSLRRLLHTGEPVKLGARAFDVLMALVDHRDRVVGKDELFDRVWPGLVVEENNLQVQISTLRALLGATAITTVPRQGYRFTARLDAVADGTSPAPTATPTPTQTQTHTQTAASALRTNLPDVLLPLIGRADDAARLGALLAAQRLVTLVGPGGVGKSRLARLALHERRGAFRHGVSWVDLAALPSADRLAGGVSAALGLATGAGDPLKSLLAALAPLEMLIALDNAEHLADAVAALAQAVHDGAPGVRLLVTSQSPLKVAAECVYRLGALAVPPPGAPLEAALGHGALALFAERAQGIDSRFALSAETLDAAVDICRRLDGLPLSIELAAARAPLLGVRAVAGMLDERLRALTGGRRDAPARHRSLHAALQWSHGLLGDDEQRTFRRLGVFAGSFSLALAQQVVADDTLDAWRVLEAIGTLAERSLLALDGGEPGRFRLLETTRLFALERLAEAREAAALERRHAEAYRGAFDRAYDVYFRGAGAADAWRAEAMTDLDNGLAAAAWGVQHDPPTAVALSASLALVVSSERPHERRRLLDASEPFVDSGLPAPLRARWHLEAAFDRGAAQPTLARRHAAVAVELYRAEGDGIGLYRALSMLLYCKAAEPASGQTAEFAELQATEEARWPAVVRAQGAHAAACWFSARGDFDIAIVWRHRTLALYGEAGASWPQFVAQANLMDSLLAAGRVDEAVACGVELQAKLQTTRQLAALPAARMNLAAALLSRNDCAPARALAAEGWPQAVQLAWQPYWADYLALLAVLEGRPRAACRLLGYAEARYAESETWRDVNESRAVERARRLIGERLDAATVERLVAAGQDAGDDEAGRHAFAPADDTADR